MGKSFQVALDDALFKEYNAFKVSGGDKTVSKDKIARILRFSGGDILTNHAQYVRLGLPMSDTLKSALMKDTKNKSKCLEELVKATEAKIILTDDRSKKKYPYVDIDGDEIDMVLGGFLLRGVSRDKATEHIKNLCADARTLVIYDRYFSGSPAKNASNVGTLTEILPKNRKLDIVYHKDTHECHITNECIARINTIAPDWNLHDKILPDHHDRYLVVNDKIEIILTSGFDHLSTPAKEFSYIIRKYNNRFA